MRKKTAITHSTKTGFTIVEITLAMAALGVLMITIALIVNQVIVIYQKGLTLKSVNSVGRALIEEFTSGINSAPSVDIHSLCNSLFPATDATSRNECISKSADKFIFQQYSENITPETGAIDLATQFYGIFCTGNYSYLWNTKYALDTIVYNTSTGQITNRGHSLSLTYLHKNADNSTQERTISGFRLLKVKDPSYRVCSSVLYTGSSYKYSESLSTKGSGFTINILTLANTTLNALSEDPREGFLEASDVDLYLYELEIAPPAQNFVTLHTLLAGGFVLGTKSGNININRTGDYCDVNNLTGEDGGSLLSLSSQFTYCGINRFNFAARTAGK